MRESSASGPNPPSLPEGMAYADGSSVQEGDWVKIEQGRVVGRVSEIVGSREQAAEKKVQGLGVVIDAPPRGFVFLSEHLVREDPLQFVRRGPGEEVRMYFAAALGLGALLVLPALYSLVSAIYQAMTAGEVLVISLGRTETRLEMVPWRQGWARFAGPIVLLASLCAFDYSRGVSARWWLAGAGVVFALILLGFSLWFTTLKSASVLCGILGALALVIHIVRKQRSA